MRLWVFKTWIFVLLISCQAQAQAQAQSSGKSTAVSTGRFEAFMSTGYFGASQSSTQLDLSPGFQFVPLPKFGWFQVGGEMTYQQIGVQGGSTNNFLALLGVTANLGGATLNESFFASLGFAIRAGGSNYTDPTAANPNGVGYYFIVGKRIPLGGGWCLRPSLGVVAAGGTGFVVRPLAVSYHF